MVASFAFTMSLSLLKDLVQLYGLQRGVEGDVVCLELVGLWVIQAYKKDIGSQEFAIRRARFRTRVI